MLHTSFLLRRPDATGDADGGAGGSTAAVPEAEVRQETKSEPRPEPQPRTDSAPQVRQDPGKAMFTPEQQAQIDELVAERVKRAEKNARQTALKEAEAERRKGEMDELERVRAEKEEADQRAIDALAERDRVLVNAEARVAVLAAGVPAERLPKALRLLDLDGVEVADGRIDAAAVRKAVETLKAEIPELFALPGPPRSGGDFSAPGEGKRSFTAAEVRAMSASEYADMRDEIMAAMREGRYNE
jgi:hypothetical protein